jgi:hypothetical protein
MISTDKNNGLPLYGYLTFDQFLKDVEDVLNNSHENEKIKKDIVTNIISIRNKLAELNITYKQELPNNLVQEDIFNENLIQQYISQIFKPISFEDIIREKG